MNYDFQFIQLKKYLLIAWASFRNVLLCCYRHLYSSLVDFNQEPVVQSIVSLTISLRHKFVKQISAKVTNTLLFFVEKM